MKSDEIEKMEKSGCDPGLLDIAVFLKEIAYQLAIMNETQAYDPAAEAEDNEARVRAFYESLEQDCHSD